VLAISSDEKIVLGDQSIKSVDDLASALEDVQKKTPSRPLAHESGSEGFIRILVQVLDALKKAGVKNLPTLPRRPNRMIRDIVIYGEPVLRTKGKRIEEIDDEIRALASDMLETMYDASGVGLAAQQVGRALQLTVIDISDAESRRAKCGLREKRLIRKIICH